MRVLIAVDRARPRHQLHQAVVLASVTVTVTVFATVDEVREAAEV